MPSNVLLVEAEDMALTNYRVESGKTHASGGSLISLFGGIDNEIGSASWKFSGTAGSYDLELGYFDESDGVSTLEVRVDNKPVTTITLDRKLKGTKDSAKNFVAERVVSGLALKPGQTISIVGKENVGEGARIDYFKLSSAVTRPTSVVDNNTIVVEAENMTLNNYRVESGKTHASGGSLISLFGGDETETGSASWKFSGTAGSYDLELGYFDESDGVSTLEVRVDNKPVTTITLDRQLKSAKDSAKTFVAERVVSGLALKPGQTISIVGKENVGEGARVDYFKLTNIENNGKKEPEESWTKDRVKIVYPGKTIFQSDFESGLAGWKLSGFDNRASGIFANPDPNQPGNNSAKFVMEAPDKREELNLGTVPYNSEITYHFSVFLPKGYVADPVSEIVAQWHTLPDFHLGETWPRTGPVLTLSTQNGQWSVGQKWDSRQIIRKEGQGGLLEAEGSASYGLGKYKTGVWTDWTFHVKWSYEDDGLLEVWQNDKLVVRETGPTAYNDEVGPYLKVGLYNKKWQSSELTKRELYYDNVKVLSVEGDGLLKGGKENNLYVLNARTASASQIRDTGGDDTLYFSDRPNLNLASLQRQKNDLLLDINRDKVFALADDLTIANFFGASKVGSGFIEKIGNLDGYEVFNAFGSDTGTLA